MKKVDRQKIEIAKDKAGDALKIQKSAKEMDDKLRKMGIERSHRGPRISDPAHTKETGYSN